MARGGLGNALRFGYLGVAVQVETSQKGAIEITSDSVETRARKLAAKVKSQEHEELLSELSEHQKVDLRSLIGKPFFFEENMRLAFRGQRSGMAIPDPNSLEVVLIAQNHSIERELAILPDKAAELAELLKQAKGGLSTIGLRYGKIANTEIVEGVKTKIEEILNADQRARLKQLAYQVEIERIGLGDALVQGYLGKELKLDEEQKRKVGSKSKVVEDRIADAVLKIKAAVKHDILRELTPIQREDAIRILGKDFAYREEILEE